MLQKDTTALLDGGQKSRLVDYVRDEVADRMMERLLVTIPCSTATYFRLAHYAVYSGYQAHFWHDT